MSRKSDEQWWYFTFGYGQKNAGHYVRIFGTYGDARQKMFDQYGENWAFQYSEQEWESWAQRCKNEHLWMLEKPLE